MGENFLALRVQTGDLVAVHHELRNPAQEIAVEGHAVRIGRIFFGSVCAVDLCRAHPEQLVRGGVRIVLAHQRRGGIMPDAPVIRLRQLREQLHIRPADGRQVVIRDRLLIGRRGGVRVRFCLSAADDRQQADHAHQKCSNSLFHCIPPVIS